MAALKAYVALFDAKGEVHSFGPGDEPPAWAAKKITNPKAWEGDSPAADEPDESGKDAEIEQLKAELARLQAASPAGAGTPGSETSPGGGGDIEPPPLAGPGAGRDSWAAYAANFADKVQVGEDDKRDEIVAKLRDAGIRVE